MSDSPNLRINISFQNFEFSEEIDVSKPDVACAVFLNDNCVDKLYLNKDSIAKLSSTNPDDRIRFIFRSKQTGAILGCISFLTNAFLSHIDKKFDQWITLFDCPEDDEFDGELGEDDEEEPRVLLQFEIKENTSLEGFDTPKGQRFSTKSDTIGNHNLSSSFNSKTIEASPIKINKTFEQEPKVLKEEETENSYSVIKKQVHEENICSVTHQLQYSFNHDVNELMKESNSSYEMKETPRLDPKPSVEEKSDQYSQPQPQKEVDINSLEVQLSSLVKVLQEQREMNGEFRLGYEEPEQLKFESRDESKYLISLEYERNIKLQEILRLTENRLLHMETTYQDLDAKYEMQIQGLVDKNRVISQDNQGLRDKIQELEEQLESVLEKASEQVEAYSEKCSRQLELAASEDHMMKNKTLEKLNNSLKEELSCIKSFYQQEKKLNQNMQADLEAISNQYKEDANVMKETSSSYNEQINQLSNELFKSREIYSELELETEKLTALNASLESEVKIKTRVISGLKTELQEYQELTENLRKALKESKPNSEKEITALRQELNLVKERAMQEENFNRENTEKMKEMERQIKCFDAGDYENRIQIQMKELESYENVNKNLKEVIEKCRCEFLFGNNEEARAQIEIESEREKRTKVEEKLRDLTLKCQEQLTKLQMTTKENFELKEKLEDLETEKEQYCQDLKKMEILQEEHQGLWNNLTSLKNHLALNASELVNQVSQVLNQKEVIKNLNDKLQLLDSKTEKPLSNLHNSTLKANQAKRAIQEGERALSTRSMSIKEEIESQREKGYNVKQALETRHIVQSKYEDHEQEKEVVENPRLARSSKENTMIEKAQEITRSESVKGESAKHKSTEIDQRLKELMKKTKIPMKFVRIGEGLYVFGSKRVHVKALNGKLVIRIRDAYLYIEEFIRLYAHQELTKLKTMKGEISYTNIEDEELPSGVDTTCIIYDSSPTNQIKDNKSNVKSALESKEESTEKKRFVDVTARSASMSYKSVEPHWSTKKELNSSLNPGNLSHYSTHRSKEYNKAKSGHIKGSPSMEFSPRFQSNEDDVKKFGSNIVSEQKVVKENSSVKRDSLRK